MIRKIKEAGRYILSKIETFGSYLLNNIRKSFNSSNIQKVKIDKEYMVLPDTINDESMKSWVLNEFPKKYSKKYFEEAWKEYQKIKAFKINENIFETNPDIKYTKEVQHIVKLCTTYYLTAAFSAMKIDLTDPNVLRDKKKGNIGTPGRIAKMWVGANLSDDTELLSGRWIKSPRLASFPEDDGSDFGYPLTTGIPITKRVDIVAVCSHHTAPFSSMFRPDAYALISYIPDGKMLGISKLQRITDYVARRGWLQEDLTKALYKEVADAAGTPNVYVRLYNIVHNCEFLRGAQSKDGCFTSEYYGGSFKTHPKIRQQVLLK